MPDLKHCPFCGHAPVLSERGGWAGVGCMTHRCPAYLHALVFHTAGEAVNAWNCRIDGHRHGPVADGSQKPNDAAAIPCAKAGSELLEARNSQHVLKAEGASPDATDRENCANASPGGGPMGVGQAAAAAPAGVPEVPHG